MPYSNTEMGKICKKAYQKEYRSRPSTKIKQHRYYIKYKDRIDNWRKENKEILYLKSKQYREKNKEALKIKSKIYRTNNADIISEKNRLRFKEIYVPHPLTKEQKEISNNKISIKFKGKIPINFKEAQKKAWLTNKGRIKSEVERLQMSLKKKGKIPKNIVAGWNKGLKLNEEQKTKLNSYLKRYYETHSIWNKNGHHNEETKRLIKNKRATQILPKQDTSIEIKIQNFLKQLNITFFTHQYIKEIQHGYQCDILIPSMKLVIECDGDYWHKFPIGRDIDKIRTSELISKGFKVLRLWEHEINIMDLNKFEERLSWQK